MNMNKLEEPGWHSSMGLTREEFLGHCKGKMFFETEGVKAILELSQGFIVWHGYVLPQYRKDAQRLCMEHLEVLMSTGVEGIIAPISKEFPATRNFVINKLGFKEIGSKLIWR